MIRIDKSPTRYIGIKAQRYKGYDLIDIRNYAVSHTSPQGYPTPKGISIPIKYLEPLLGALEKVAERQEDTKDRPR